MTKPKQEEIPDREEIRKLLQRAFPAPNLELQNDLWPAMLCKLDQTPINVPWYDWGLAAVLAGILIFFPKILLLFAYHL
jgi:hypothetical protein